MQTVLIPETKQERSILENLFHKEFKAIVRRAKFEKHSTQGYMMYNQSDYSPYSLILTAEDIPNDEK